MRCKECGMDFRPGDEVCEFCGAPAPIRKKRIHRVAPQTESAERSAFSGVQQPAVAARTAALQREEEVLRRQKRSDVLFGVLVTFLVLLVLLCGSLCYLLLTRGPDAATWFSKHAAPTAAPTAVLTPVPTPTTVLPTPEPTPELTATPEPTATPTPTPTLTPTPKPTTAAEAHAALETLVLEGIERNYTKQELQKYSKYELSVLRNGMYAYSGLIFDSNGQVRQFFEDCDWYDPDTKNSNTVYKRFNTHQTANVNTIVEVEKEKGYR